MAELAEEPPPSAVRAVEPAAKRLSPPTRWRTVPRELLDGDTAARVHTALWKPDPAAAADESVVVCLHGLGGSHLNWSVVGPRLAARGSVVWAPDLLGFGLTPLDGRRPDVDSQVDLVAGFVRSVTDRPVRLIANSTGGLIALFLAAERPELVSDVVLSAPAVPLAVVPDRGVLRLFFLYGAPWLAGRYVARQMRRRSPSEQTLEVLDLCAARPELLDDWVCRAHASLVARRRLEGMSERAVPPTIRSLLWRIGPQQRKVWAAVEAVQAPVLLVAGERDRLIRLKSLQRLAERRPDWDWRLLADIGHAPMVEDPSQFVEAIDDWDRSRSEATGGSEPA